MHQKVRRRNNGRHKLILPRMIKVNGKRIVWFSILMDNVPGMLEKVTDVFARYKANILWGMLHAAEKPDEAWWCFYTDLTNLNLQRIVEEVEGIPGVKYVFQGEDSFGNYMFDFYHTKITMNSEYLLIFRRKWLINLFEGIYRWGSGGQVFVYTLGLKGGEESYPYWRKVLGIDRAELTDAAIAILVMMGWISHGSATVDIDKGEAVVKLYGNFECEPFKNELKEPRSQFIRGVINGFFSSMFKAECETVETKCIAKGDPYCEFQVKTK